MRIRREWAGNGSSPRAYGSILGKAIGLRYAQLALRYDLRYRIEGKLLFL